MVTGTVRIPSQTSDYYFSRDPDLESCDVVANVDEDRVAPLALTLGGVDTEADEGASNCMVSVSKVVYVEYGAAKTYVIRRCCST